MDKKDKYNLLTILGPTASGKTALAAHMAAILDGEVISADSRQVYRGMDIGTGKDLDDYIVDGVKIPVHLTDIADAGYQYNVFEYQRDFLKVLEEIRSRGKFPVLCGGSGLYLEAVMQNYRLIRVPVNESLRIRLSGKSLDELSEILLSYKTKLHNITDIVNEKRAIRAIEIAEYYSGFKNDLSDLRDLRDLRVLNERNGIPDTDHRSPINDDRLPITEYPILSPLIVGIKFDVETRRERITRRLHQRLSEGMVEEVQKLLDAGIPPEDLIYYGLEYKFITQFLTGSISHEEMTAKLNIAIHQFAKRQMTWFRKMEREGTIIHWLDGTLLLEDKIDKVIGLLEDRS